MPGTYSAVPVVATGDWITAGWVNTYLGGNLSALWAGLAAGDIEYYISAVEKARLAKPSVDSILGMGAAGTPSWLPETSIPGMLHAKGSVNFSPGQTFSTSTFTDITGATLNLTLTTTCTVLMMAVIVGYNGTTGRTFYVRGSIDGNVDATPLAQANGGAARNEALPYFWYMAGITAGTRTVKLQCRNDSDPNIVTSGRLQALAFAE